MRSSICRNHAHLPSKTDGGTEEKAREQRRSSSRQRRSADRRQARQTDSLARRRSRRRKAARLPRALAMRQSRSFVNVCAKLCVNVYRTFARIRRAVTNAGGFQLQQGIALWAARRYAPPASMPIAWVAAPWHRQTDRPTDGWTDRAIPKCPF